MKYQATSDFEIHYPHPLEVKVGDTVAIGRRDTSWNEWVWVTLQQEKLGAWMHESMLQCPNEPHSQVTEDYSAREISVKKNDIVDSLRELGGWHWCRKTDGVVGWIPDYVLEPV